MNPLNMSRIACLMYQEQKSKGRYSPFYTSRPVAQLLQVGEAASDWLMPETTCELNPR